MQQPDQGLIVTALIGVGQHEVLQLSLTVLPRGRPFAEELVQVVEVGVCHGRTDLVVPLRIVIFLTSSAAVTAVELCPRWRDASMLGDPMAPGPLWRRLEATSGDGNYSWSLISGSLPPGLTLAELEQVLIRDALRRNKGNRTVTARELGINASTLFRKIKSFGM